MCLSASPPNRCTGSKYAGTSALSCTSDLICSSSANFLEIGANAVNKSVCRRRATSSLWALMARTPAGVRSKTLVAKAPISFLSGQARRATQARATVRQLSKIIAAYIFRKRAKVSLSATGSATGLVAGVVMAMQVRANSINIFSVASAFMPYELKVPCSE